MEIKHYSTDEREKWDAFVSREPCFALLQSWGWGDFKEKLGWKPFRIVVEERGEILAGALLLIKPLPFRIASLAYIPRGPIGNWLDSAVMPVLIAELHRVAKHHRAIFLKIEPPIQNDPRIDETLKLSGFRISPYNNQPRATIVLSLEANEDEIQKRMRKKTRASIQQARGRGVTYRIGTAADLETFFSIMESTARREGFSSRGFEYYKNEWDSFEASKQVALLLAELQDQPLVVRMIYRFGKHAAAFHSGSSSEHRDVHANSLLVWEAIQWAKQNGCMTYDFWGIPEEVGQAVSEGKLPPKSDRTDGLWGVYRFKSGFSKNIIYYLGAYDFVYAPFLYKVFTNSLLKPDTLEKFAVWFDGLRLGS